MSVKFATQIENKTMHPELTSLFKDLKNNKVNIIFYGPSGCGKSTQSLFFLKEISPSKFKYDKKITIEHNKNIYYFRISDIHIEIDMELLGCQSLSVWNCIYNFIMNMTFITNTFYIVCKNFHMINDDLLANFDCYMQKNYYKEQFIHFILLTNSVSFIQNNILNKCQIINIARPNKTSIRTILKQNYKEYNNLIEYKIPETIPTFGFKLQEKLLSFIIIGAFDINEMRQILYELLVYNINTHCTINYITNELIRQNILNNKNIKLYLILVYNNLKLYNNNYRSIFHLESYVVNVIRLIHE